MISNFSVVGKIILRNAAAAASPALLLVVVVAAAAHRHDRPGRFHIVEISMLQQLSCRNQSLIWILALPRMGVANDAVFSLQHNRAKQGSRPAISNNDSKAKAVGPDDRLDEKEATCPPVNVNEGPTTTPSKNRV